MKWLKHQILYDFGISSPEAYNGIARYSISDTNCLERIVDNPDNSKYNYHDIIFVPINKTQNLQRLHTLDAHVLEDAYKRNIALQNDAPKEIWHARYNLAKDCCCGRLALFSRDKLIVVELLNGYNLRKLDEVPTVPGYVRLEHDYDEIHFREIQTIAKTIEGKKLVEISSTIARQLEEHQEKLLKFGAYIGSHGAENVTFDFVFSDNEVKFFDWDCGNEEKVLLSIRLVS